MFLLDWYREYLDIKAEAKVCESCEALKMEVAHLREDNHKLLDRICQVPETEPRVQTAPEPVQIKRPIPWNVRRQMLEAEDRERAKTLKKKAEEIAPTVEELKEFEKELDNAAKQRESAVG